MSYVHIMGHTTFVSLQFFHKQSFGHGTIDMCDILLSAVITQLIDVNNVCLLNQQTLIFEGNMLLCSMSVSVINSSKVSGDKKGKGK